MRGQGAWDRAPGSHYFHEGNNALSTPIDVHCPHHTDPPCAEEHAHVDEYSRAGWAASFFLSGAIYYGGGDCTGFFDIYIRGWKPAFVPTASALGGTAKPQFQVSPSTAWVYRSDWGDGASVVGPRGRIVDTNKWTAWF